MSATNRGATRNESDFYPTSPEPIEKILSEIDFSLVSSFVEPCKADEAIYKQIPLSQKDYAELREGKDYFDTNFNCDLIVTNPPFSLALEFLEKSLKEAKTVVYLLRLNFLGSQKRKEFWQKNPPSHLFTLSERPCFSAFCKGNKKLKIKSCGRSYPKDTKGKCECSGTIGNGTDATEYAWFVWDRGEYFKRPNGIYVI